MRRIVLILLAVLLQSVGSALVGYVLLTKLVRYYHPVEVDSPIMTITTPEGLFQERPVLYLPPPRDPPPAKISVGPYRWSVKFAKMGSTEFGDAYYKSLEFRLDPGMPRDQLQETLLHEIFHACEFVGAGGTSGPAVSDEARQGNDMFIEEIAPTLPQVMRDNPELVAWLARR